ncbi:MULTISPECIES: hypothetical protein [unclassified Rhodococcus (in: high G+C Gram-positive bacteria)]|uniref:hypothetical protein n=1 Tax=unclassified Rhodococcus (in: high G+C Gram-positive bacteria) TaxID=192944 RepID=UPI001639E0C1|nr:MULTISPECIES: hypothetical protein [unclassified Rhodococcus (in: high G+C Gram-positive bacteria)]MBC2644729.1 hypothetical protein [Rhodococcus sp. 3A]
MPERSAALTANRRTDCSATIFELVIHAMNQEMPGLVGHHSPAVLGTVDRRCSVFVLPGESVTAQVLGNQCGPRVIGRRFDPLAVRGPKGRYCVRSTIARTNKQNNDQ